MHSLDKTPISDISLIVSNALSEDIGNGDITGNFALTPKQRQSKVSGLISLKDNHAVICGLDIVREVFLQIDRKVKVKAFVKEGSKVKSQAIVCAVSGTAESILKAERTALNFLGRLSGIATQTRSLADITKKCKAKLLDTRKTTPGLNILEKYAVKVGGGKNHRFG